MKTLTSNRRTGFRLSLLTAVVVSGLAVAPEQASAQFIFTGVNNTTMQFPDVFGNLSQPQLFQTTSILSFDAPLQVFDPFTGTVTPENNPFNLSIAFAPEEALANGALSIVSATETSGLTGGSFLQQFWQLSWVDNQTFQGIFTDSQFGNLANQPNLINSSMPLGGGLDIGGFPFPLAPGTELIGQFSPDFSQVNVQVSGNTTDLARPFFADITAAFAGQRLQQDVATAAFTDETAPMTFADATAVPESGAVGGLALITAMAALGFLRKGVANQDESEPTV